MEKRSKEELIKDIRYHRRVLRGFEITWILVVLMTVTLFLKILLTKGTQIDLISYTISILVAIDIWRRGEKWEVSKFFLELELAKESNLEEE